ncbi:L,D-transpeptidase [Roseibium sp.]|jgi:lipoprotein-anchoring transpeptidase ErfK/SrfK|uniref:L,D-transpeptidase n=1 Tax=Roseibium sp. TaxID=1936156 RepID=UPI003B526316
MKFRRHPVITRRDLLLGSAAVLAASQPLVAEAHHTAKYKNFKVDPQYEPQSVRYGFRYERGTIVVDPKNHFLYLIEGFGKARRYGVGVGKAGLAFKGIASVERKAEWPSWRPTKNMIRREPGKYAKYAKGVPGGLNNPLGARALYLYKNGRDTMYRIHGTTQPKSIGRSVSNGCIRMINDHVIDLYNRVPLGTKVVVL